MKSIPVTETRLWPIIKTVQQLIQGRTNATGAVTLTTSSTTTVVLDANVAPGDVILLSPLNADAAAEVPTLYVAATDKGTFTLTHTSAGTTRTFGYKVAGG